MTLPPISRRSFLVSTSLATAGLALRSSAQDVSAKPLAQFGYADVALSSALHNAQFENTHRVLMGLSDDALLKPFRAMAGQPAPGEDLGGWYTFNPHYEPNGVTPRWCFCACKSLRLHHLTLYTLSPCGFSTKFLCS